MEYFIVFLLVILSAFFSGLTLGFFSLGKDDLERKAELGDKKAKQVYKIRKNGNLLLCTLLIGNVAVNSTLSIFLGSIASGVIAGIVATALIVVFGEIIPQAVFSRYALSMGARFAWVVQLVIYLFLPICWPIAWILDKVLGDEISTIYSKRELMKLIEDHEDSSVSDIDADEEKIIKGALSYADKNVQAIMTPRTEIFSLKFKLDFDDKIVKEIYESGHSRIPVYKETSDNIVGILYAKDLIRNDYDGKTVGELAHSDVIFVDYDKPLDELLNAFKKTRHHMFIVVGEYGETVGIVTIEDVLEEIIGAEIVDEYDKHTDMQQVAKNRMKKRKMNRI